MKKPLQRKKQRQKKQDSSQKKKSRKDWKLRPKERDKRKKLLPLLMVKLRRSQRLVDLCQTSTVLTIETELL